MTAEKNDVDISVLFNFGRKFEIKIGGKKIPVFVRLIGDADLNRARVKAIRRSAELRNKLKDSNSDEAVALLPDTSEYTKDILVESVVTLSTQEVTRKVINELEYPYPNELDSEATLEEQEKYQKAVDEFPTNRISKIKAETITQLEKLRVEMQNKTEEQLSNILKDRIINSHCEREMMRAFSEASACYGCFKDKNFTVKMFESFEQFEDLLSDVKEQILGFYDELEIDSDTLKK